MVFEKMVRRVFSLAQLLFSLVVLPLSAGAEEPFSFDVVVDRARELAGTSFEDRSRTIPDFLLDIDYDRWRDIRFRPEKALWKEEGLPFQLQFFHPGLFYDRGVTIHVVDGGRAVPLPFDPESFDYGANGFKERIPADLGYAGFRIHYPINRDDYHDEIAVFLGASYFRAVAEGHQYGLSARGLAVDTALPSGEEFPWFREFWVLKPAPTETFIKVFALLDSPSATGAYRFIIVPGTETRMNVSTVLFQRRPGAKLGMAPLTSMFFYGEESNGRRGDFRPEVHDSDGLQVRFDTGEWLWRPLKNPSRLEISAFQAVNPRGFGLLQRDIDFDHYQDLEAGYERRPSLWVEPRGDWGAGHVELIEIPTELEMHDNIVAFWVPRDLPQPGEPLSLDYVLRWTPPRSVEPSSGRVVATRMADGRLQGARKIVIDFEGGELEAIGPDAGLVSVVTVGDGARLMEKQLRKNVVTGGWRLVFQVVPEEQGKLKGVFATGRPPVELRAFLKKGENLPDVLTETWSYSLNF